jgi:chromatin assembly factor 1 subunit B
MKTTNVSFIYKKNSYNRPCLYLPHDKPSVAISVCPLKFELHERKANIDKVENIFSLPYRYIFAIATEDSVYFYDTENLSPYAFVTGIHYSNLSDISWSNNGRILTIASIDGFCSFIVFNESELGKVYDEIEEDPIQASSSTEKKPTTVETIEMNTNEMKSDEREQLKDETVLSECIVLEAKADKKDENKKANTKRIKLIPLA